MGPGAWLLGTTARHSEMKPDAEESVRKRGAGVRVVHPGLGVSAAQAARTPGGLGVCGGSWWGCLSGCSDPQPTRRQALGVEAMVGRAGPAIFVISPHLLSLLGLQFVWDSRVQAVTEAGAGAGLGRNA